VSVSLVLLPLFQTPFALNSHDYVGAAAAYSFVLAIVGAEFLYLRHRINLLDTTIALHRHPIPDEWADLLCGCVRSADPPVGTDSLKWADLESNFAGETRLLVDKTREWLHLLRWHPFYVHRHRQPSSISDVGSRSTRDDTDVVG
jgi:hypothetical protein